MAELKKSKREKSNLKEDWVEKTERDTGEVDMAEVKKSGHYVDCK